MLKRKNGNFSKFHEFNEEDKELIKKWAKKEIKTKVLTERFKVKRGTLYNYVKMLINNGEFEIENNLRTW